MVKNQDSELSSAGHKLGQLIGDWWETKVIYPLLNDVAESLDLFLDNRIVARGCRNDKVQWADADNNLVDYDFVLEYKGSTEKQGIPVAFIESFWRRGARHSKDKARDDTNKLLPMRDTYPTARFLAIAACGAFTAPARTYVHSRNVELFFVSKEKFVEAFDSIGAVIDYPDTLEESKKAKLASNLEQKMTLANQAAAADALIQAVGKTAFDGFKNRIHGSLSALPQEIRVFSVSRSSPVIFRNIEDATEFLETKTPAFPASTKPATFEYEVTFSDGTDFSRRISDLASLRALNTQLFDWVQHIRSIG
jgi:hypothetical protein